MGGNRRCIINLDGKQRKRTDEREGSEMSCSSEMEKYMSFNSTYSLHHFSFPGSFSSSSGPCEEREGC